MNDAVREGNGWVRVAAAVGGVLVLSIVGALAWLGFGGSDGTDRPSALHKVVQLRQVWESGIAPQPAVAMSAEPIRERSPEPAASQPIPPGHIDVCGVGVVSEIDWTRKVRVEAGKADYAKARKRVVDAFRADPDEMNRAVALVLQSNGGEVIEDEAIVCEGKDCPKEPTMFESEASRKKRLGANKAPRNELARMALASRSPDLYGLAWNVCRSQGQPDEGTACQLLSLEQWARLDPVNVAPWMALANAAKQRGDRPAVAEALYRVSLATQSNPRMGQLNQRMLGRLPTGVTPIDAFQLGLEVSNIEVTVPEVKLDALMDHCSVAAVRDANRQQQCDAVAEVLVQHGSSASDLHAAVRIGERVGWPKARTVALREDQSALMRNAFAHIAADLSCATIDRSLQNMKDRSGHGELEAGRRRAARPAQGAGASAMAPLPAASLPN